jgi:hypothetical protein
MREKKMEIEKRRWEWGKKMEEGEGQRSGLRTSGTANERLSSSSPLSYVLSPHLPS